MPKKVLISSAGEIQRIEYPYQLTVSVSDKEELQFAEKQLQLHRRKERADYEWRQDADGKWSIWTLR